MVENNRKTLVNIISQYILTHDVKEKDPLDLYNQIMDEKSIIITDRETSVWILEECEKIMIAARTSENMLQEVT